MARHKLLVVLLLSGVLLFPLLLAQDPQIKPDAGSKEPAAKDSSIPATPLTPGTVKPATPVEQTEVPELTIGSVAPPLDIEHWVQNGNGKFGPITDFASGKVYIVEFWATWCGPCISAMPHIVATQQQYADQGLQVVSISEEDLETVQKFLEKPAPGKDEETPKTFGELTSAYCLTTDPDGSNHKNYMHAAGRNGIPCAFIVGKTGLVEWIGHPMRMDSALASIVAGDWDRDLFAVKYKKEQEYSKKSTEIQLLVRRGKVDEAMALATAYREAATDEESRALGDRLVFNVQANAIMKLAQSGNVEQALSQATALEEAAQDEVTKRNVALLLSQLKLFNIQSAILKNTPEAPAMLASYLEGKSPSLVNNMAWNIVRIKEQGRNISDDVLAAAAKGAEAALQQAAEDSHLLDTYAHLLQLTGKVDQAIEIQQRAVQHATAQNKESVEGYLKKLQELKNAPAEPKAEEPADAKPEK